MKGKKEGGGREKKREIPPKRELERASLSKGTLCTSTIPVSLFTPSSFPPLSLSSTFLLYVPFVRCVLPLSLFLSLSLCCISSADGRERDGIWNSRRRKTDREGERNAEREISLLPCDRARARQRIDDNFSVQMSWPASLLRLLSPPLVVRVYAAAFYHSCFLRARTNFAKVGEKYPDMVLTWRKNALGQLHNPKLPGFFEWRKFIRIRKSRSARRGGTRTARPLHSTHPCPFVCALTRMPENRTLSIAVILRKQRRSARVLVA